MRFDLEKAAGWLLVYAGGREGSKRRGTLVSPFPGYRRPELRRSHFALGSHGCGRPTSYSGTEA